MKSKAKSSTGLSPFILRKLIHKLLPFLMTILNNSFRTFDFPTRFLESSVFFLHKKGSKQDPNNYRSIVLENPFLKLLTSILTVRISTFTEQNDLLPTWQFGFRKVRSTTSASALLFELVNNRLSNKKRTFVCFVDFSKCFDTIRRDLLFIKLQTLGVPYGMCQLLDFIYRRLLFVIRSGKYLSEHFVTKIGLPQGDPLSPILFSLFTHDLLACFPHLGPLFHGIYISYIMFADDLCIIAESADELQTAINSLANYCSQNGLRINASKTKCMAFYRGRPPTCSFTLENMPLESVNEFTYLGFQFTTQLSFSAHLLNITTKANSRCATLMTRLPIKDLPLNLALQLFNCYC